MTIALDRLPFDILYQTALYLQLEDVVHLSYTCRQLKLLLEESTLCRRLIEAHAPHSKEARLAQLQTITYGDALRSIYDRRHAFSNAYPFSARTIGQGNSFTYRQGVLCILQGSTVSVSDLHFSSDILQIDLGCIMRPLNASSSSSSEPTFSLLYYSDGILAVGCEWKERPSNGRILAISTSSDTPEDRRLIQTVTLESSSKLFVRHTASFLYYGTYTGAGEHGHHEWEIQGVSLDPREPPLPSCRPLQLIEFFGTDIGSTIAFEIHNGFFYALSNQTSFDVEELDWTSFYHCIRFPLDNPVLDSLEINPRVYRRQHAEGPIHDSWTDLTIQFDECTNEPVIVESRREWQKGSSRQLRTFYVSKIEFGSKANPDSPLLPDNDLFTDLLDHTNRPHYAPEQPRCNWNFHTEFGQGPGTSRSFILARTKFRAYNYSCSSFLDLVEDERCCNNRSADPCLRIRVGSRRVAPLDWDPNDKADMSKGKSASVTPPVPADDAKYRHSAIKMWPPPASRCPCSQRLHDILNPKVGSGLGNRSITAAVDERSMVYMVKPGRSYSAEDNALGTIVLVNFNRNIRDHSSADDDSRGSSIRKDSVVDRDISEHWEWAPEASAHCKEGLCS